MMALRILMRHAGELILFFRWENSFFFAGVQKETEDPGTRPRDLGRPGTSTTEPAPKESGKLRLTGKFVEFSSKVTDEPVATQDFHSVHRKEVDSVSRAIDSRECTDVPC